jgi:hypothetical protein
MMRQVGLLVGLMLAARIGTADDKARGRDGSGSSGHSADVGARHHSSASSSSSSSGSGNSSSSSSAGSTSSDPTPAQRRHPRAGTGTGYAYGHYGYGQGYGYGYPYGSFYFGYPAYYYGYAGDPGYYGYPGYNGYPQPAAAYPPPYPEVGSLRLIVDPAKTRVYVDGYYAGVVDDFDGMFQRLHVSSGRHDVTLKLDGYRTHRFRVYVPVDHTIKLRYEMVRGQGEDADEVVGEPDVSARPAGYARLEGERDAGRLRVDVRPPDASIYVDAVFRGTARELDGMPMPPGRHHVEIVRPGYRTLERDIEIRPGESTDLRADLERSS